MSEPSPDTVESRPVKPRKPWLAGLLSLLATGVGQVYNGQWRKGVGFLAAELVFGLLMIPFFKDFTSMLILLAFLLGFNLFVAGEAYATARGMRAFVPGRSNRWWIYAAFVAGGLGLGLVFDQVVTGQFYRTYKVPSRSMVPTILVDDHFMVEILGTDDPVERGNIVIFRSPIGDERDFVKRVIGLPGETVEIQGQAVFIDGVELDEPYALHTNPGVAPGRDNYGPVIVPEGTCFVLGDNREESFDSRMFGPVDRETITGRALYIYFPGNVGSEGWGRRLGMKFE
jgi:signal peptidase I